MYKEIITRHQDEMDESIKYFEKELKKLRTGRANPALVESILIESYGVQTPIKQVANISTPEARQLLIQPWDRAQIEEISKCITQADLGGNVTDDGVAVRIIFPAMTEENRKDIVKILNQKSEEARVRIRAIREESWKEIQVAEKNNDLTEDEKFSGKDALQDVVGLYNKKIEEIRKNKEIEIMTV